MSFFSPQQRYEMLCSIKYGNRPCTPLSLDEERFIEKFAMDRVQDLLKDPECRAAMDRMYESKWAHRFD